MKKVLSFLLALTLLASSMATILPMGASAEVPGNLITNGDFNTATGLDTLISNQIPSPAWAVPEWPLTDAGYHKWFRATLGGSTVYSNIITIPDPADPENKTTRVGRMMQTALQGVTVAAGKTYQLTFSAKADYAFQQFQIGFFDMTSAKNSPTYPILYPVTVATGTKTYNNNGTPVVQNITPTLSGGNAMIALETDKWSTYKLNITIGSAATSGQVCALRFFAGEYGTYAVPFYLDDVSLVDLDFMAAANAVIAKINAIGTVTLSSKTAIEQAESAYTNLTPDQQALVTNYSTLTAARTAYDDLAAGADQAAADAVIAKINAIGTVTLSSKTAIEQAESAYTNLTPDQQDLVTNYSTLTAARTAYDDLVAGADAVIAKINAIGTVTLSSKTAIEQAESAYANLTPDQQALVTNYNVLVAARAAYNEIKPAVAAGDINGDGDIDYKDITMLSRVLAGWSGVPYIEGTLNVDGVGDVDFKDITLLSRFVAGWNVTIYGGAVSKTSFKINTASATAGTAFSVPLLIKDISKLGGDIAGYQLTITYDSTKVDFTGYTAANSAWLSDSNITTPGTAVILAYDNNINSDIISADGQIGTLNFTAKGTASGTASVAVTVTEATNSAAIAYTPSKIGGSTASVTITAIS